jgi:hypothetical protein
MRLRRSDSIRYPRMGNARNSFGDGPSLGTDVVAITRHLRGCRCLGGILHFSLCQVARRPSVGVAPIKMIAASPSGPTGSASSRAWTSAMIGGIITTRMTGVHFSPSETLSTPFRRGQRCWRWCGDWSWRSWRSCTMAAHRDGRAVGTLLDRRGHRRWRQDNGIEINGRWREHRA